MCYRVSFGGDENVLELDSGDVCTTCEPSKNWTIHFKMMIIIRCELYLNFFKTQKEEASWQTLSKGIFWTM